MIRAVGVEVTEASDTAVPTACARLSLVAPATTTTYMQTYNLSSPRITQVQALTKEAKQHTCVSVLSTD